MVADSTTELLAMAHKIGLNPKWIQNPGTPKEHFDLALSKRKLAVAFGAIEVTSKELAALIKQRRLNMIKAVVAVVNFMEGELYQKCVTVNSRDWKEALTQAFKSDIIGKEYNTPETLNWIENLSDDLSEAQLEFINGDMAFNVLFIEED